MSDNQEQSAQETLRHITAELRDFTVPTGPPVDLVHSTIEMLAAQESPPEVQQFSTRRQRMIRITRYVSLSTALVIGILGLSLLIIDRGAEPSFADALKKLRESRTISFRSTVKAEGIPTIVARQTMASPGFVRIQMRFGEKESAITIFDQQQSAGLTLMPKEKKAIKITSSAELPKQSMSVIKFIGWLKTAQDHSQEDLGPKTIDGKATFGFRVTKDNQPYEIWIDQQTGHPVRMESKLELLGMTATVVLDEFVLDEKLNKNLFSLTPPAGYKVIEELKVREPSAKDVVVLLQRATEASEGKFPAALDIKTLSQLPNKNPKENDSLKDTYTLTLAFLFLQFNDVNYTGKDIKLGDSKSVVCWWTPKGEKNFRAIYGDLSIRNGTSAQPKSAE